MFLGNWNGSSEEFKPPMSKIVTMLHFSDVKVEFLIILNYILSVRVQISMKTIIKLLRIIIVSVSP
jgi:hypothetical protein